MKNIMILRKVFDDMVEHARREAPREACGLLGGRGGRSVGYFPVKNIAGTDFPYPEADPVAGFEDPERSFFMDPVEQVRSMERIEGEGLDLMGIFHSHPFVAPLPSDRDFSFAFFPDGTPLFPGCFYLILSLAKRAVPQLRVFRMVEGKRAEEAEAVLLEETTGF